MGGLREYELDPGVLWRGSKTTRETQRDCRAGWSPREVCEHRHQVTRELCDPLWQRPATWPGLEKAYGRQLPGWGFAT